MTERLYFFSDALETTATVLSCTDAGDGIYAVVLDRSLFHPQGGGQPSDTGVLGGVRVLKVLSEGDTLRHITDGPVAPGPVTLRVEAAPRLLHSRLHSAGHVLAAAAAPSGWRAVKAHHWPGEGRVVFEAPPLTPVPDTAALTAATNALIGGGHQRVITPGPDGRQVGFGLLPATLCGGTHVTELSVIGPIRLTRISLKKGVLTVSYDVDLPPD
ncbi:alanyl-tRNA editing protein [Novispirillum itersonii]|uniref:Ser-tRNA(Ala) deacylase AlaX n=1 Tax=Novispirillum itersonii TaxID=189 RepID=A0A7X0DLY9_NOVIT|nr:alanyl-tRNA editing protein [Novispirillum itersonii]MBB6210480.1 Ser-tRNA(Ala) deacylase AlaX [Novispirillum itersonii]